MADGEVQSYYATAGEIIFNDIGILNGERVDGEFNVIFGTMGSLYGSFYTRIGLK